MDPTELKKCLMQLIGDVLDETSLSGVDSFVEMDNAVLHCALDDGDYYFKVSLTRTTDADYFKPYDPESGGAMEEATRKVRVTFTHDTLGDGVFVPLIHGAFQELYSADPAGTLMEYDASNGVKICIENLDDDLEHETSA